MWKIPTRTRYWTRKRAQARQPRTSQTRESPDSDSLTCPISVASSLTRGLAYHYSCIIYRIVTFWFTVQSVSQFYIGGLRTFPGFMIPLGSKACFTAHIMSTEVGPNISSKRMILPENWTRLVLQRFQGCGTGLNLFSSLINSNSNTGHL